MVSRCSRAGSTNHAVRDSSGNVTVAGIRNRNHPRALLFHIREQLNCLLVAEPNLHIAVDRRDRHQRHVFADQRIRAVLQFAGRVAFGLNVRRLPSSSARLRGRSRNARRGQDTETVCVLNISWPGRHPLPPAFNWPWITPGSCANSATRALNCASSNGAKLLPSYSASR